MGEMLQMYHPYKLLQWELLLEMQIEGASLVTCYCKPSLLECLSETTLLGFEPVQSPTKVEAVLEFVNCMKDTLSEAQAALVKSKDDMAHYYNHCHMPAPAFAAGDKVFLDTSDIHTTHPLKKLSHHFLGPFPVVHPVGLHTYHLRLPPSMSRIHPVFHVVKLMPVPNDPIR